MSHWLQAIAEYWRGGGLLLVPITLVAFCIWASLLHLCRWMDNALATGRQVEDRLDHWLNARYPRALLLSQLEALAPFPGRAVARALRASEDPETTRRAFDESGERLLKALRARLLMLRALTGSAPLLGLLGTVSGMVRTFAAVKTAGVEGPALVADGISTALITTQFGLIAALPGLFGIGRIGHGIRGLHGRLGALGRLIHRVKTDLGTDQDTDQDADLGTGAGAAPETGDGAPC